MRNFVKLPLFLLFLVCFLSCKTKYIKVETVKKEAEYINRWYRDSIHVKDSIFINKTGDTVLIEKNRYIYKDKLIRDSIYIRDSIKVEIPYPVEVKKEVNKLNSFQSFQMWCGRILLFFIIGFLLYKFIKKKIISK